MFYISQLKKPVKTYFAHTHTGPIRSTPYTANAQSIRHHYINGKIRLTTNAFAVIVVK